MPKELLTIADTAQLLGYSENYVRRLARCGQIPAFKMRRRWIFAREKILDWLNAGCPSQEERPSLFG